MLQKVIMTRISEDLSEKLHIFYNRYIKLEIMHTLQ